VFWCVSKRFLASGNERLFVQVRELAELCNISSVESEMTMSDSQGLAKSARFGYQLCVLYVPVAPLLSVAGFRTSICAVLYRTESVWSAAAVMALLNVFFYLRNGHVLELSVLFVVLNIP